MPGCAVVTCRNTSRKTKGSDVRYFGFPKEDSVAKQWIVACGRQDTINVCNATICSIHFERSSYLLRHTLMNDKPSKSRPLKPDAVPTLNLPLMVKCKENVSAVKAENSVTD